MAVEKCPFTGQIDSEAALWVISLCSSRSPDYIHLYSKRFSCNRHPNPIGNASELALLLSCLVSRASNILSSCFHFTWVDHVVYEGLIAFKLIERAEL